MKTLWINVVCLGVLTICILLVIANADNKSTSTSNDRIQSRIKTFLTSHCSAKNHTIQQHELDLFSSCNPSQAASTFTNLEMLKKVEPELRHAAIQKEITIQCAVWNEKRKCQKKNFQLIEKCFDGQQEFVFYFMLALSDTICQDNGEVFIRFWERGGEACLKDHLAHLTRDIAQCFVFTETMTKAELDRNLHDITLCIGRQFSSCQNADSREVVKILLNDIESFYYETRGITAGSATNSPLAIISLTLTTIIHRIIFS